MAPAIAPVAAVLLSVPGGAPRGAIRAHRTGALSDLTALGLGPSGIAVVAVPLGVGWIALAVYLGREETARSG